MRLLYKASPLILAVCTLVFAPGTPAQVAGQNVNMVSGTSWPGGDPFLQRQNEPSMAVSTRNPMHLLAGANDYRTVDLETVLSGGQETGDSWLGLFKSFDGGLTWRSTLLPGCKYADPQCVDNGALRGGHGYDAGSDPVVRAGPNGMFYYAGLAFDRATSPTSASGTSTIFVARYNDLNNNENADPITYIDTHIVATGDSSNFLDKPALAVDIPRSGANTCSFTAQEPGVGPNGGTLAVPQSFAAGNVYMTYTNFLQGTKANSTPTHLMFRRSTDCGVTWSAPVQLNTGTTTSQGSAIAVNALNGNVYVVWRQFASTGIPDAIMVAQSRDAGRTFSAPVRISTFVPFDQGTTGTSIRTNAYPSITTDMFGLVYVAFSAKNLVANGDARVVVAGSWDGTFWTPPIMVDNPGTNAQTNPSGRGHQIMPAITFANGRLTLLYYDLRLDHYENIYTSNPASSTGYSAILTPEGELASPSNPSKVFTPFIDDAGLTLRRHTLDLRTLELGIFPTVTLGPSVLVSQYAFGCCVNPGLPDIEQIKFNVPNLPIFSQGQVPFLGDYIDVVPSPAFIPKGNSWVYNFTPSVNPLFHATWTDNRDVVPPLHGDWTRYTPPVPSGTTSVFNPGTALPSCQVGQEGMRNQNIYTAQITGGLIVGAPGNAKPLGTTTNPVNNQTVPFQRAFAVVAQNVTNAQINVRFSIANQPPGGKASFLQFTQLTNLDVSIPPFSSVSRSVFVTSTNAAATVTVNVVQIGSIGGAPITNGLSQSAVLNPDVTNPNITNPNVTNPNITNPNVTNYEVTNPNITNPSVTNPNITNPNITNPNITNPNITNPNVTNPNVTNVSATNPNVTNPNITNPDITNPNITNPNITNPNVTNGSIQDVIYPVTNNGNTTATYTVQVAALQNVPTGLLLQLILDKLYQTPVADQCKLGVETHWVTVANITNPKLYAPTDPKLGNPNITNSTPNEGTITLAPGETAYIDFRVISTTGSPITINPLNFFVPVTVPHAVNTQTVLANPGGTPAPPIAVPPLIFTTQALPDNVLTSNYTATVGVQGGNPSATHTFSVPSGSLPPGLTLNPATGAITGTPTTGGTYTFSVQVKDAAIGTKFPQHTTTQVFTIHVVTPLTFSVGSVLPGGTQGTSYNQTIAPVGGLAPFTVSLISGAVPAGLMFNNGAITGTPTGTGTSNFTVQIVDSTNPSHQIITQAFSINIVSSVPVPANVTFIAQPRNSVGGQILSGSPITVRVMDNQDGFIPNAIVTMSFNGTPPCATAVLSGATPTSLTRTTDAFGVASFPDLSVDRGQIGYRLKASVGTVSGVSNAFTVNGFCGTGNLSVARENLTSTLLQNGMVLVAGGQGPTASNAADLYDPTTGAFTSASPMQTARYLHTATLLNDGTVLIVGGQGTSGAWITTAEIFNPANGTFTNTTSNPVSPRSQHTATLLAEGTVLITGGFYNSNVLNSAEIYDPVAHTFTSVGPMNAARLGHTATLLANGRVLVATGLGASAEVYDPVAKTFTTTGSLNTARQSPSATLLSNGKVLIAGGLGGDGSTGIATAELYDPIAGTFSLTTGGLNTARGYHTGTLLTDGTVLLAGGYNNVYPFTNPILASAEIYNPTTSTFSNTGGLIAARWQSTATILNDGTVLTAGGFGSGNPLASAERFYSTSPLAPLALTTPNVTVVANKQTYQFLQQQGGVGKLTWSLQSGSLPAGIVFNSTNGLFSGNTASTGNFPLLVTITDSSTPAKSAAFNVALNVIAPLLITTTSLPNGTVGVPYSAPINTSGGTAPIFFSLTQATFPPGLFITQPATGPSDTLAGTPTTAGTYNFFEAVTDSAHPMQTAMQNYSVTINPAPPPPPATLTFTTEPANETTNQNLPTFVVQLTQNSAPVSNNVVSLALSGTGCSTATLGGNTSTTTDANGNATFNSVFIDRGSNGYTLTATSTATPSTPGATTTSTAFNVPGFCATGAMNTPRDGHAGVLLANGSVLVAGGFNTVTSTNLTSAEIYTGGSFAPTGNMSTPRVGPTATLLTTGPNAGSVLIAGGIIDNNSTATPTVELFKPTTGTFTLDTNHMSVARFSHTATLLANGDVLIAGGSSSNSPPNGDLGTAEIYHAADGTFSASINMTSVHSGPTATLLPNGKVLIAGGQMWIPSGTGYIDVPTAAAELFDPTTNTFTATGSMNVGRREHVATLLPNGTVLVAAGNNTSNTLEGSGEIYDPNTGKFTLTTGSMTPTINASAVLLPSGKILITGGQNAGNPQAAQAQLYDPVAQTFTTIPSMVSGRKFFPLSVLNDGTVLVPGGFGASGSIASSEIYFPDPPGPMQFTTGTSLVGTSLSSTPADFAASTNGANPIGFNGILPAGTPFLNFNPLTVSGIQFSTPTPGTEVNVTKASYYSPNNYPADFIIDSGNSNPSNQLVITLPQPTRALGLDYGGFAGGTSATLTLSNGFSLPLTNSLPAVGHTQFSGFVSATPFSTLTFTTTNDSWVVLDLQLANANVALPDAIVGSQYTYILQEQGGVGPLVWSLANGTSLPTGITLGSNGIISGTPTLAASGTYSFAVQAVDSSNPQKTVTSGPLTLRIVSGP